MYFMSISATWKISVSVVLSFLLNFQEPLREVGQRGPAAGTRGQPAGQEGPAHQRPHGGRHG